MLNYVGYDSHGKVRHQIPLLSLQKTREYGALIDWVKKASLKLSKWKLNPNNLSLTVAYKLDGISLSLLYSHGSLLLAKSRGNGHYGEDLTEKAKMIPSIPSSLSDHPSEITLEIRGELCCDRQSFQKLCKKMESLGLKLPSSERNIVAGIMSRKDHPELAQYFTFLPFNVMFTTMMKRKLKF